MTAATHVLGMDCLSETMGTADVVALALALTVETERFIGASQLAVMKPDAWLVNVARGKLIDTDALVDACLTAGLGAPRSM